MATLGQLTGPRPRSWTKPEYYRLAELGFFQGQRVELLEGKIVVLSPQNAPHWSAVDRVTEVLQRVFAYDRRRKRSLIATPPARTCGSPVAFLRFSCQT
jgi:hypothetical protein